jgi:hypothetical protein
MSNKKRVGITPYKKMELKREKIPGDFLLAILIALGVVIGDIILKHLPS